MTAETGTRACVFSLDDNYVIPFKVFWHSLMKTKSIPQESPVYILHSQTLSLGSIRKLKVFCHRYNRNVQFLNAVSWVPHDVPLSSRMTIATYFRLFLAEILPSDIQSAVYLDADMLAVRSVRGLFEAEFRCPIFASDHFSPHDSYRLWGATGGGYFQAGVIGVNLAIWRENKVSERFYEILKEQSERIRWWDQDILNIAFDKQWERLPVWYNLSRIAREVVPESEYHSQVKLLHFDGGIKPWQKLVETWSGEQWYDAYAEALDHRFDKSKIKKSFLQRLGFIGKRLLRRLTILNRRT